MKLPGLVVPPLTPFAPDLSIDKAALKREIDYIVEDCNAAMVSAAGVEAAEYQCLSMDQRKDLIRTTIDFVDGRTPVVVGVSHPNVRTAIELSHLAEDAGAHAIQVLAPLRPFGGPPTLDDLVSYYEAISAETSLPIMLYLNAGPGADVNPADTVTLARLPKVKYVKESSRDLARVSRLIVEIDHGGHARYFTTMQMLLATISLGGSGATMPPPAAYIANEIIKAYGNGDYERAAKLQLQFAIFPAKWMPFGLTPTMKAAMDIIGLPIGDPYPPFKPITGERKQQLESYLRTTFLFDDRHVQAVKKRVA